MDAVISSRTPEGEPFRCPACGAVDRIEPSRPPGDAPCPSCGQLLWFSAPKEDVRRPRLLREHAEALLRSEPRRPMFGVVATIARGFRRAVEARRRREPRPARVRASGVWDPWLDG